MPSDLNFDEHKKELEGANVSADARYIKGKTNIFDNDDIKSYSIRGKLLEEKEPKYKCGSIVKEISNAIEVKLYDEEKSGGLKSLWESVVGYTKRDMCMEDGYIYIFSRVKEGFFVNSVLRMDKLFKIFVDGEESKIRLVFHNGKEHLVTKNLKVKSCWQFMDVIMRDLQKVGLVVRA
jgi:hypothetical protein